MTRVQTWLGIALIIVITIWAQRISLELLGPGSLFYDLIKDITWPVDGDQWADQMYVSISVWFMWIIRIGAIAYGFYAEIVRQNVSAQVGAQGAR